LKIDPQWFFHVLEVEGGLFVDTNIPLENIRKAHNREALTRAYLLNAFFSARYDLWLSARYMSEIVTSPISSTILSAKFSEWIHARDQGAGQIEAFQIMLFEEAHAIAEAVNEGRRTIRDVLALAEQSGKFKEWLVSVNPDVGVISEYYKSLSKQTWLERLPGKSFRFAALTAAGILLDAYGGGGIGTVVGTGLGAADALLLDKFIRGWRPNQFVERRLQPFLSEQQ
jgi:hypothetical protein